MKEIRFSIAKLTEVNATYGGKTKSYIFWFRTNWMDTDFALTLSHELKLAFPAPWWKITLETKETHQTTETIN
jgi:hypothetical protein